MTFWFVTPYSVAVGYQQLRGPWYPDPEDGGSMDLWNFGILPQRSTRRLHNPEELELEDVMKRIDFVMFKCHSLVNIVKPRKLRWSWYVAMLRDVYLEYQEDGRIVLLPTLQKYFLKIESG